MTDTQQKRTQVSSLTGPLYGERNEEEQPVSSGQPACCLYDTSVNTLAALSSCFLKAKSLLSVKSNEKGKKIRDGQEDGRRQERVE